MIVINDTKFINGEEVYINNGRMQGIIADLVGVKEKEKLALVKSGTFISEVEMDFIEKIHFNRSRLFVKLGLSNNGQYNVFHGTVVATGFEELEKKYAGSGFKFWELDEVDGYDVILQK